MKPTLRPLVVLICVGALVGVGHSGRTLPERPGLRTVRASSSSATASSPAAAHVRVKTSSPCSLGASAPRSSMPARVVTPRARPSPGSNETCWRSTRGSWSVPLGGNDYLRRVPSRDVLQPRQHRRPVREQGAAVVLVGVAVGLMTDPYREEYEALAERRSAGLVPDILDGIIGHADLMSDSIHPNGRGYAMIADRLEPILRELTRSE